MFAVEICRAAKMQCMGAIDNACQWKRELFTEVVAALPEASFLTKNTATHHSARLSCASSKGLKSR